MANFCCCCKPQKCKNTGVQTELPITESAGLCRVTRYDEYHLLSALPVRVTLTAVLVSVLSTLYSSAPQCRSCLTTLGTRRLLCLLLLLLLFLPLLPSFLPCLLASLGLAETRVDKCAGNLCCFMERRSCQNVCANCTVTFDHLGLP